MTMLPLLFGLLIFPFSLFASILPAAFNECRVGQLNTYNLSQPLISQLLRSHTSFMSKWWTYRCEIEPWIGCRIECTEPNKHLSDPFTFCFSDIKAPPPVDSKTLMVKHMRTRNWVRCNTYFVNGSMSQGVYDKDRIYGMIVLERALVIVDDWRYNSSGFGETLKTINASIHLLEG